MAALQVLPRLLAAVALTCSLGNLGADAANASEPHPHQGVIPRLKMDGGKPKISLTSKDLEQIEDGQLWMHTEEVNGIGRGLGIRDIAAPWEVVFGEIADLKGYVSKVPMLSDLKVYSSKTKRSAKGSEVVEKATYMIKVIPGYKFEYYLEHHAVKSKKTLLFFLDYDRSSDFNDMQGRWFLEEHPTKPGWTRVYYQCELKLWGYAPAIVKTLLTSKGLSSSIGWVKKESAHGATNPTENMCCNAMCDSDDPIRRRSLMWPEKSCGFAMKFLTSSASSSDTVLA